MKIFIGCSASNNLDEKYYDVAQELASSLSLSGHDLIYGSGDNGMMGIFYRTFKENNRKVTSVVPKIFEKSTVNLDLDRIVKVDTTDQEISYLAKNGDMSIILPGGYGAIAEMVMCIYTRKAGEHSKPLVILNAYGFYDDLISMFEKSVEERFSNRLDGLDIYIVSTVDEVLDIVEQLQLKDDVKNV